MKLNKKIILSFLFLGQLVAAEGAQNQNVLPTNKQMAEVVACSAAAGFFGGFSLANYLYGSFDKNNIRKAYLHYGLGNLSFSVAASLNESVKGYDTILFNNERKFLTTQLLSYGAMGAGCAAGFLLPFMSDYYQKGNPFNKELFTKLFSVKVMAAAGLFAVIGYPLAWTRFKNHQIKVLQQQNVRLQEQNNLLNNQNQELQDRQQPQPAVNLFRHFPEQVQPVHNNTVQTLSIDALKKRLDSDDADLTKNLGRCSICYKDNIPKKECLFTFPCLHPICKICVPSLLGHNVFAKKCLICQQPIQSYVKLVD